MNTKMKWLRTLLLALALIAWLAAPGLARAQEEHGEEQHEGEHHEEGHESDMESPDHPDAIVSQLLTRDLTVQHYIAEGELTKIHVPAFEARDLAQDLEGSAHGLTADDTSKLSTAVKRIASTAKELDKYGDANDAAKTDIVYRSFAKAIQDIKSIYPNANPSHYWTCSMHPEEWSATEGRCPKCKMFLIEKGEAEHEEHNQEEGHSDHDEDEE